MLAAAVRRDRPIKVSPAGLQIERDAADGRTNSTASSALDWVRDRLALPTPEMLDAAAKVNGELSQCRFPVGQIKCECTAESLILTGVTSQYYYVQIALETAMRHAAQTPVQLKICVASQD